MCRRPRLGLRPVRGHRRSDGRRHPQPAAVRRILPQTTWRTLLDHQVTDFAAAPTVYRGLRSSSAPVPQGLRLERASSAGSP